MKAETWLKKAQATDNGVMAHIHGRAATDGRRLHFDPSVADVCGCASFPDTESVLERARDNAGCCRFTTKTAHLVSVCQAMLAFCWEEQTYGARPKRDYKPMRLSVNGTLSASLESDIGASRFEAQDGDMMGFIGKRMIKDFFSLKHEGTDGSTAVNPKYFKDALSGMGEDVSVSLWDSTIYVADGQREAVIMAVHIKE
jgi:hypothetical protein